MERAEIASCPAVEQAPGKITPAIRMKVGGQCRPPHGPAALFLDLASLGRSVAHCSMAIDQFRKPGKRSPEELELMDIVITLSGFLITMVVFMRRKANCQCYLCRARALTPNGQIRPMI